MRRSCAAAGLLIAALGAESVAQDGAAPGAGGRAATEPPKQSAEALAALTTLQERFASPGDAGFKELRCLMSSTRDDMPVQLRVRWRADRSFDCEVVWPNLRTDAPPDALRRIEWMPKSVYFLALGTRTLWDRATLRDVALTSERRNDALVVGMTPAGSDAAPISLGLGRDGRPTWLELNAARGSAPGPLLVRCEFLEFVDRPPGWAASRIRFDAGGITLSADLAFYESPAACAVPRRVDLRLPDGSTESYVFHDLVLDDRRVEGTSRAEALAGRPRRIDDRGRATLRRFDAAIDRSSIREASCRIDSVTAAGNHSFSARWTADGTCECRALPGTTDTDVTADFRAGFAVGARGFLQSPSTGLDGFDVKTADPHGVGGSTEFLLEAIDPAAEVRRVRALFNDAGLLEIVRQTYRDGSEGLKTVTYRKCGDRVVEDEISLVRGDYRATARYAYYDVPGLPPLRRLVESRESDGSTGRQVYSDWVVNGKPVPQTSAEGAPAPPK